MSHEEEFEQGEISEENENVTANEIIQNVERVEMVAQPQRKVVTKSVSKRKSVENQIQELLSTVKEMQEMMQGMINQNSVDKAKGPSSVRDGRSEKAATGVKTEGLNRNDLNLNIIMRGLHHS